jgi:hypothetical protein
MDLDFTIRTKAELAGAEQTADALERQIGKAKALKQDYSELQKQLDTVKESLADYKSRLDESGDATEGISLKKRELMEGLRGLSGEFPMLGEAARLAFNSVALGIGLVAAGIGAVVYSAQKMAEVLGAVDMPDLSENTRDAEKLATAYSGVAKAVGDAQTEFNSAPEIYKRQTDAITAQLTAIKALIQAEKDKAVADLDIERAGGKISPAGYAAQKAMIEQGANASAVKAEIDARNQDLAARKAEAANAALQARNAGEAAGAIKLPADNKVIEANLADLTALQDAAKKQAADARARLQAIQDFEFEKAVSDGGVIDTAKLTPQAIKFNLTYGKDSTPESAAALEKQNIASSQAQADAAARNIARIEKEKADRDKLRAEAEAAAKKAGELNLGLQGEDDPNRPGSTAWKNAQAARVAGLQVATGAESGLAGQFSAASRDVADLTAYAGQRNHTPADLQKAKDAVKDASSALREAGTFINELAGLGEDVGKFRQQLADLEGRVAGLSATTGLPW